jgi:hypothetical protein
LKILGQHRKILTGFLLALYVFTATPVSLWHRHKAQSPVALSVEKTIKAIATTTSDADCPICKHHYSAFNNDAITFSQNPIKLIRSITTFYSFQLLSSPAFLKPNKGPPALA